MDVASVNSKEAFALDFVMRQLSTLFRLALYCAMMMDDTSSVRLLTHAQGKGSTGRVMSAIYWLWGERTSDMQCEWDAGEGGDGLISHACY